MPPGRERGIPRGHHDLCGVHRRFELRRERRGGERDALTQCADVGPTEALAEDLDGARRRVLVERGDTQQRRLARAVRAQHDPALVAAHGPFDAVEDLRTVEHEAHARTAQDRALVQAAPPLAVGRQSLEGRPLLAAGVASCQGRSMGSDDPVARRAPSHDRFPCFDGVRALAALMVVVYHAVFFNTDFLTRGGAFLGTLNAGVWIFFVTSGCLLYLPFAASHVGDASGVDPRGYAVRRLARVYPAYWLVLAFFTFIVPRVNIYGLHGFLLHTTLTQTYVHINPFVDGLPPAWSLVVEISFYAFLPAYAAVIGARARRSRPLPVELTGLAVLFAIGLVAIVAIAFGLDMAWVTVLPQHLG